MFGANLARIGSAVWTLALDTDTHTDIQAFCKNHFLGSGKNLNVVFFRQASFHFVRLRRPCTSDETSKYILLVGTLCFLYIREYII